MVEKIEGKLVAKEGNFRIYVEEENAKRSGKNRIWIHVRQDEPKSWRIYNALIHPYGVDIRFEQK